MLRNISSPILTKYYSIKVLKLCNISKCLNCNKKINETLSFKQFSTKIPSQPKKEEFINRSEKTNKFYNNLNEYYKLNEL